jgi:hypothetical protein
MKILAIIGAIFLVVVLLGWLGLQIKPRPFPDHPQRTPELKTVPVPPGLPAPVERFYRTAYGDSLPVIETAVLKGRAVMSPFGVKLPARFIFIHNAGKDYRHYIEATLYGLPIMKINEGYVDGHSHFELPIIGAFEDDPSITQAAVLGLWAEAGWFPSIWVTDPRVRWEPVDDHTALLYVPFGDEEENFVVRFDPETGLIDTMEAMRFRDAGSQSRKILWITKALEGPKIEGANLSTVGSATWFDQGKPWAVFTLEDVVYNVDVSQYVRRRGP